MVPDAAPVDPRLRRVSSCFAEKVWWSRALPDGISVERLTEELRK
jgi:hypothetical protein